MDKSNMAENSETQTARICLLDHYYSSLNTRPYDCLNDTKPMDSYVLLALRFNCFGFPLGIQLSCSV